MTSDQHLSRRSATKLMTGAAAGAPLLAGWPSTAHAAPRSPYWESSSGGPAARPTDLHFEITHRFRPIDLIPPSLVQFDTDRAADRAALAQLRSRATVLTEQGPAAPWASVIVDVRKLAADGTVTAGLAAQNGDAVRVRYDAAAGRVSIEAVRRGGTRLSGVHVIKVRRLDLPFAHAAWDPALRLIDGRWHYAYVNVTGFQPSLRFRPVLAVAARRATTSRALQSATATPITRTTTRGAACSALGGSGTC